MIPHERSLVERWKDEPFAIVGVNTDGREAYAKGMREQPVTWRSFDDGSPDGPISKTWDVNAFPTIYVLDHRGVIRHKNLRDAELEQALQALIAEAKAAARK
jgi:hypothetical protein